MYVQHICSHRFVLLLLLFLQDLQGLQASLRGWEWVGTETVNQAKRAVQTAQSAADASQAATTETGQHAQGSKTVKTVRTGVWICVRTPFAPMLAWCRLLPGFFHGFRV